MEAEKNTHLSSADMSYSIDGENIFLSLQNHHV